MDRKIVAFLGKQRVGKTFASKIIFNLYDFTSVDTVYEVKQQLARELMINEKDDMCFWMAEIETNKHLYRQRLIEIVQEWKQKEGECCLVKRSLLYNKGNVVLQSIRHVEEYEYLVIAGATFIRLTRDVNNIKHELVGEDHPTETSLDDAKVDYLLDNNSDKKQLCLNLIDIMEEINAR